MRDIDRRRMIQLSGGIALASMAGCLGSGDEDNGDKNDNGDNDTDDNSSGDEKGDGPKSGDDAPKVDLETPDGKTITLEHNDEPTVVMFADITSEKGRSHSEMLVELHEKYDDHVYMTTVNSNLDVSKDDLEEFHEKYGGDWDHAMGTKDALEKYGIDTAVTVCVIDTDGTVVLRLDGDATQSTIEQAIETYSEH